MPQNDQKALQLAQKALCSERATALAEAMVELDQAFTAGDEPFAYSPPTDDDWTSWSGIALWCAIQSRYKWYIKRYAELCSGKGPYYCAEHEPHVDGGRAALCLPCSWDAYLRDEAMADARAVRGIQQRQRQAVYRGDRP